MAVNGAITQYAWTDSGSLSGKGPKAQYIAELRAAIDRLSTFTAGVTNCGFSNYCQTCQSYTCQSVSCQACQACQICQSVGNVLAECRGCQIFNGAYRNVQCDIYGQCSKYGYTLGVTAKTRFQCVGEVGEGYIYL